MRHYERLGGRLAEYAYDGFLVDPFWGMAPHQEEAKGVHRRRGVDFQPEFRRIGWLLPGAGQRGALPGSLVLTKNGGGEGGDEEREKKRKTKWAHRKCRITCKLVYNPRPRVCVTVGRYERT